MSDTESMESLMSYINFINMNILYVGNKLSKYGYTPTSIETLGPLLEELGFKLYYASDKLNIFLRMLHTISTVWKYRNKINYILIDTYSKKSFYGTFIISILSNLIKIKYILILRSGDLYDRFKTHKQISKIVFDNAYKLISPSEFLKIEFKKQGYEVSVIPNNILIKNYKFIKRHLISPKLLFVRSFHSRYNPQMAIRVLYELKKIYGDAELCMVGPDKDGSMEKCKKLAEELGISDSVLFAGKLSKPAWHKLSEKYNVFINTTNVDNTPVSVIEAMALGLPIVSTNVGGIQYLLEDGKDSILIEKGNVLQMTEAIKSIANDELMTKNIVVNARKKAKQFDWSKIKEKWKELLK
jgi:glycosyltransferase involved in cell wall biosynthesis